ncbi:MAG: Uncharacterised protein [Methanobacteriota archaeon]|nr:MAG: Uncharacterised protein [Euryarchaeota archaeon]
MFSLLSLVSKFHPEERSELGKIFISASVFKSTLVSKELTSSPLFIVSAIAQLGNISINVSAMISTFFG